MTAHPWIPGRNCDVILQHGDHAPLPLVCFRTPADPIGPRVRIHYEVYLPDTHESSPAAAPEPIEVRHLWFTALIADRVLCPNGAWYPFSADEVHYRLNAILLEKKNIRLKTQAGTILGLYGKDHAVIDTIYQNAHTVDIHLSTRSLKDLPALPRNMWVADAADVSSSWGAAVWH